jgi:DNA-binding NarL/FixJ family response regulator
MGAHLGGRLRVVVADDHPSIRENLRYLLNAESDLECVGTVSDALRCVDICLELVPDVLVLDKNMPGMDGLAITRALQREAPDIRIVMYTFDLDACAAADAAGAFACVAKDGPYELLLRAIRAARPHLLPV